MKLLIATSTFAMLAVILLIPNFSNAQSKYKQFDKTTIQVGVFYDEGEELFWGRTYNIDHASLNKIAIGRITFTDSTASQMLLEASYYKDEFDVINPDPFISALMERSKTVVELEYFRSFKKKDPYVANLYFGYLVNGLINLEENLPYQINEFVVTKKSLVAGLGLKAIYLKNFKNNVSLILSSDLSIFNIDITQDYHADPSINSDLQTRYTLGNFSIIRPRLGIDFGIVF